MRPADQVAHERRETGTGDRVPPPNVDRAAAVESPAASLQRKVEIAAAVIVWLLAGGGVGASLAGTFEENDILGSSSRPPFDAADEGAREDEEPDRPAREPPPPWLVPPQP